MLLNAGGCFLNVIETTPYLTIIYSEQTLEAAAKDLLRQFNDQSFSYTDAVSFAVMRQRKIADAFAFDQHFTTAGFTLIPAAAR